MASTGLGLATFSSSARRASGALASTPPRAPLTARRASPRDIPPRVETFLDVPELVRGLESSPVRSRLLTNALRHSVERTVDEWRAQRGADLHPDSQPPPTPAAPHLVRFLRERLGRNLYVGDHDPSRGGYAAGTGTGGRLTPGGDLLVALGPERPDGGAWTGSDLARVRSHLRDDMIKRLDARVSLAAAFGASIVARVGPGGETARVHIHTLSDVRTDTTVKCGTSSDGPSSSSSNVVELADVLATDDEDFAAAVRAATGRFVSAADVSAATDGWNGGGRTTYTVGFTERMEPDALP